MSKKTILILILGLIPMLSLGQARPDAPTNTPVPYTLGDRERLIKVEVQVSNLQDDVRDLRGDINTLRGDMISVFMWGFGLVFSAILGLVGFIIWDRRSSNQKIIAQVRANKTRIDSVERKLVFKP